MKIGPTGVPELDEITLRAIEALPMIPADYVGPESMPVIVLEIFGDLGNPLFVARYIAYIAIGDFGYYRIGHVSVSLYPKHDGGRTARGDTLQ